MRSKDSTQTYLDYAATTPVDPRVLEEMMPFFSENYGNPSSIHILGQMAESSIDKSRQTMAEMFNCLPEEIIFTSCGSESNNLALRGGALAARKEKKADHILISPVEHDAVSKTALQLTNEFNFELEYLPVNEHGQVLPSTVAKHLREDTAIVSVIFANNEIGSINNIAGIGQICRDAGVVFHTDAVQAAAHLPIDTKALKIDLLSVGAHKLYGPKGIGALYVRKGTSLFPTQTGGGQEFGLRAGTSNVAFIVGQAKAFQLAEEERDARQEKMIAMRDHLIYHVMENIPDVMITGHFSERLPNHASFVFKDVDGNELLMLLDIAGFACSSGSACKTGNPEPSYVLEALGIEKDWSLGSLRITLGQYTSEDDVYKFLEILPKIIVKHRNLRTS